MAKKARTRTRKSTQHSSRNSIDISSGKRPSNGSDKKGFLMELIGNPAVRFVAGGMASAALVKVASKLSEKYPEIGRFVSEHLESLESRLNEFKVGESGHLNSTDTRYS